MRKHVPKDIKQEKHQRDETLGSSPAKRAKSDPIEIDDFDLDDEDNIEDFDVGNLDLKVSPLKFMKPEIKTGMNLQTSKMIIRSRKNRNLKSHQSGFKRMQRL